ncbi:MAG: glycerophosphodiester phosphodiesterase family protein [Thermomicrobiales bacterium]
MEIHAPERPGSSSATLPRPVRRAGRRIAGFTLFAALLAVAFVIVFPWPIPPAASFTLIAHRGVHQTFPLDGLTNETCTAAIIHPPPHAYLENTIPSVAAAFAAGADAVEIDIHRTADGQLAVFHDWTLECRTDGHGVTNQQRLADLQRLDLGYGYTADGGATYPLRGQGVGLLPSLTQVLAAFPDGNFILDDKDGDAATQALLRAYLGGLPPDARARLRYWGSDYAGVQAAAPGVTPYLATRAQLRACLGDYLWMLATGSLPDPCRQPAIGIPYAELARLPGWPHLILAQAHHAGVPVIITDVDTPEQLATLSALPIDGIQTNRIEVVGPLVSELYDTLLSPN